MTTRIGAAVAAGFLAIGILVGAAGTIVVRDATTPEFDAHMGGMAGMMSMMGAGDVAGMMSMMGAGFPMPPDGSMEPGEHESHHAMPSPAATR